MSINNLSTDGPDLKKNLNIQVVRQELEDVIMYSWSDGQNTVIMAWVHGNEPAWVIAIQQIVRDWWKPQRWNVSFVFANGPAIVADKRLLNVNMNRLFVPDFSDNSPEAKRAWQIQQQYLNNASLLLDLHASETDPSRPFLISEHKEYNSLFDVQHIVCGLDPIHKGWSDGYMNGIGKVWLCFEAGNIRDPKGIDASQKAILNILNYQKHTDTDPTIYVRKQDYIQVYMNYKNTSVNFRMANQWQDFQLVKQGTIIAYDNEKPITAPQDSYILFPENDPVDSLNQEVFLLCEKI